MNNDKDDLNMTEMLIDIKTPAGHYSYHFPLDYWELFEEIPVKSFAPTYDGHKPEGISRLFSF